MVVPAVTPPLVQDRDFTLHVGDVRDVLPLLPQGAVDCVVTSPPYLDARPDYPSPTLDEFEVIFRELARVVSGPFLLNLGRIFREGRELRWQEDLLQAAERAGWRHMDTRVWIKPNANPIHGAVFADRHEYVYVLGTNGTVLNVDAARTPYADESLARLKRKWTNHVGVKNGEHERERKNTEPHPLGARPDSYMIVETGKEKGNPHPAPMPLDLATALVALGSWEGQTVLDPFAGSGTTCLAARRLGRRSIGIELNPEYGWLCADRLQQLSLLAEAEA